MKTSLKPSRIATEDNRTATDRIDLLHSVWIHATRFTVSVEGVIVLISNSKGQNSKKLVSENWHALVKLQDKLAGPQERSALLFN